MFEKNTCFTWLEFQNKTLEVFMTTFQKMN